MKKIVLFAVSTLLIAAGCTTQYQARSPYDDVYYSSRDVPDANANVVVKQSQQSADAYANPQDNADVQGSESYAAPGGDTYIDNNYYDDYYDYAYASRLRRFHNNYYFPSYYNDFYTNMYWYDYNPWNWGTSIYYNSGWFGPSFGLSFGWGSPFNSYGWGGYPSYYGNYWNGYNNGYYNGFYNGYYSGNKGWYNNEGAWYNNDNNYYYGHRGQSGFSGGSSNGRNSTAIGSQMQGRTLKQGDALNRGTNGRNTFNRSESPLLINGGTNTNVRTQAPVNNTDAVRNNRLQQSTQGRTQQANPGSTSPTLKQGELPGRGRYIAPSQDLNKVREQSTNPPGRRVAPQTPQRFNNNPEYSNPRGNVYRENTPRQGAQPARTYSQPGTRIQSYSAPSYSKPRSSQEYTTPKYRDMRNNENYNQPQQRSGSNSNSRDNGVIRENPRRSYNQSSESQPSRSTYSAPSRSSENSYSEPSRSSSSSESRSSSGSSNSSSGSRGGRR